MRTFAYIRVSKLGEDSISPEIQRDEIERYCRQKGWTVTEWFQDLDLSGRAGVHCDSPSNPNDGSPEAELIWSISAALAKYESVRLVSLYVSGEILEGEYREARKLQMQRLTEAHKRLDNAVRRMEASVRRDYVEEVLANLAELGPEGWAALSVQAQRDVFDIVIDRVIVYPLEQRGRGRGPHKIKILWR